MSYQIHLTISENSAEGQAIASLIQRENLSVHEAAKELMRAATQSLRGKAIGQASGSSKGDPGPIATSDDVPVERPDHVRRGPRPPRSTDNPEAIIGLFAGDERFRNSIDEVIARRAERYDVIE